MGRAWHGRAGGRGGAGGGQEQPELKKYTKKTDIANCEEPFRHHYYIAVLNNEGYISYMWCSCTYMKCNSFD